MGWEPLPSQSQDPVPIAEAVDEMMTRLSGASLSTIERVMDSWPEIVGESIAGATAPAKIENGCLTVRTDDPIWSSEIRWLEADIIDRVAKLAGGDTIGAVRVVVGRSRGRG